MNILATKNTKMRKKSLTENACITYSLAMFPELHPRSDAAVARAVEYARLLKKYRGGRIAFWGRDPRYKAWATTLAEQIQDLEMDPVLYTGTWEGVDAVQSPHFLEWAQRDAQGSPLGWRTSPRQTMLCPASPYIQEVLLPQLVETLSEAPINGVFFDIPWIMRKGCHCEWCSGLRDAGLDNRQIVRRALEEIVLVLRNRHPAVKLLVNAGGGWIEREDYGGGHIRNLLELFDEYVTEWNPYRWGQSAERITQIIAQAQKITDRPVSHATTLTTRKGELLSDEKLRSLFAAMAQAGVPPWLSVYFKEPALIRVFDIYKEAMYNG